MNRYRSGNAYRRRVLFVVFLLLALSSGIGPGTARSQPGQTTEKRFKPNDYYWADPVDQTGKDGRGGAYGAALQYSLADHEGLLQGGVGCYAGAWAGAAWSEALQIINLDLGLPARVTVEAKMWYLERVSAGAAAFAGTEAVRDIRNLEGLHVYHQDDITAGMDLKNWEFYLEKSLDLAGLAGGNYAEAAEMIGEFKDQVDFLLLLNDLLTGADSLEGLVTHVQKFSFDAPAGPVHVGVGFRCNASALPLITPLVKSLQYSGSLVLGYVEHVKVTIETQRQITVHVLRVEEEPNPIPDKDGPNDLSDPYVQVYFANKHAGDTKTRWDQTNPGWGSDDGQVTGQIDPTLDKVKVTLKLMDNDQTNKVLREDDEISTLEMEVNIKDLPTSKMEAEVTFPPIFSQFKHRDGASKTALRMWVDPLPSLPPSAVAGHDRTVVAGAPIVFDGSYSSDPDDSIASYLWELTGDGITASSGWQSSSTWAHAAPQREGLYQARLTVKDVYGTTGTDILTIIVLPVDLTLDKTQSIEGTVGYRATNTITIGCPTGCGPFTIEPSGDVTFSAGRTIRLLPGFHARNGSTLRAIIEK